MISKAARYAIRSLVYLSSLQSKDFVAVKTIGHELDISATFLAKIAKNLVEHGLIDTYRGPNGGIRLARPASTITIRQIIESVDGDSLFTECVLGLPGCGDKDPCPMHRSWATLRTQLQQTFDQTTVDHLGEDFLEGGIRLSG